MTLDNKKAAPHRERLPTKAWNYKPTTDAGKTAWCARRYGDRVSRLRVAGHQKFLTHFSNSTNLNRQSRFAIREPAEEGWCHRLGFESRIFSLNYLESQRSLVFAIH